MILFIISTEWVPFRFHLVFVLLAGLRIKKWSNKILIFLNYNCCSIFISSRISNPRYLHLVENKISLLCPGHWSVQFLYTLYDMYPTQENVFDTLPRITIIPIPIHTSWAKCFYHCNPLRNPVFIQVSRTIHSLHILRFNESLRINGAHFVPPLWH